RVEQDAIPLLEVLDLQVEELGVGNRDHRAFGRTHARGPEADALDGPLLVAEAAEVAHLNGLVADHREPSEEILHGALGGQRNPDAADADRRDQRADLDAHRFEEHQDRHHRHHDLEPALNEVDHRLPRWLLAPEQSPPDELTRYLDETQGEPAHDDDEHELLDADHDGLDDHRQREAGFADLEGDEPDQPAQGRDR